MREVLFRGKQNENKEWIYGSLIKRNIGCFIVDENNKCALQKCGEFDFCFESKLVKSETIGQYTGLTDKNGKKIFEGDILQVITGDGWSCPKGTKVYYEVVFTEFNPENASWSEYIGYMAKGERGALRSLANVIRRYDAVVIGNIHDNPELLKGAENNG